MLMLIHDHYLSARLGQGHVVNGMATLFRVTLDEAALLFASSDISLAGRRLLKI